MLYLKKSMIDRALKDLIAGEVMNNMYIPSLDKTIA